MITLVKKIGSEKQFIVRFLICFLEKEITDERTRNA